MIRENVSPELFISFFNTLVEMDKKAIQEIMEARVECNLTLADHPSVQVVETDLSTKYKVGFLGLVNGLFGTFDDGPKKGHGPIVAITDDQTNELLRFEINKNE